MTNNYISKAILAIAMLLVVHCSGPEFTTQNDPTDGDVSTGGSIGPDPSTGGSSSPVQATGGSYSVPASSTGGSSLPTATTAQPGTGGSSSPSSGTGGACTGVMLNECTHDGGVYTDCHQVCDEPAT